MKSCLVIYPHDKSTSFLLDSFYYLQKHYPKVTFFEVHTTGESHIHCLDLISKYKTIIFMGHGSFQKLSGARSENFAINYLLSTIEIDQLPGKNWILFSCNSNDLLRKCKTTIAGGLGFGDLPTDYNDVASIREYDVSAYLNITDEIIIEFRNSINYVIMESLSFFFKNTTTITEFNSFVKIIITKRFVEAIKKSNSQHNKELADLLFSMKSDIFYCENL